MTGDQLVSEGHGVVVLAAYRPDPELFAIQLRSIRDQTRGDFRCLIGADGGQEGVRALVAEIVGDDARFEVLGWDDNLGFYLNFERLLMAVPADAAWVALSDQDDRWYPDKLERLVPLLDDVALATGQARVISWPGEHEIRATTDKRVVPAEALLVQNQVTGAQTVFGRALLDLALPFPRLHTITQLHDHWLAMCAVVTDGYQVVDAVVQDYIQHGGNIVGEVHRRHPRTPWGAVAVMRTLARDYEGGDSPRQVVAAAHAAGIGWRRLVVTELSRRRPSAVAVRALSHRIGHPGTLRAGGTVLRALRSADVTTGTALTLAAGLPGEVMASRRHPRPSRKHSGTNREGDHS
jgi:hypothetical protein